MQVRASAHHGAHPSLHRRYRELLGVQLPPHALRVHARLRSGSSVLLTDETPLSSTVLSAVSFYVWAVLSHDDKRSLKPASADGDAELERYASTTAWPPPREPIVGAETPSVSELKGMLGVNAGRRR